MHSEEASYGLEDEWSPSAHEMFGDDGPPPLLEEAEPRAAGKKTVKFGEKSTTPPGREQTETKSLLKKQSAVPAPPNISLLGGAGAGAAPPPAPRMGGGPPVPPGARGGGSRPQQRPAERIGTGAGPSPPRVFGSAQVRVFERACWRVSSEVDHVSWVHRGVNSAVPQAATVDWWTSRISNSTTKTRNSTASGGSAKQRRRARPHGYRTSQTCACASTHSVSGWAYVLQLRSLHVD